MIRTITAAFILLSFTSCYHVYYTPNTPNVSLLKEKDEMRVSAGLISGFDSDFGGGDLQFAYAPAKNIGVMLNGFAVGKKESTWENAIESGNGEYGEVGVGYYTAIDKRKQWIFEFYGGVGGGSVRSDYGKGQNSKVGVNKLFVQPALGYRGEHFEIAFAPRLSHVNWKVKQMNFVDSYIESDMNYIKYKPAFWTFEPGLIIRGGGKNIKGQLGLTIGGQDNENYYESPRESVVGYIGISFSFSGKKKL